MTDAKSRLTPDEFEDPLKNYDPRKYGDSLERALAEEAVAAIQSTPYTSISPDTTVERSLKLLTDRGVSCALVEEDNRLVGVFSDRDALNKVALEYATMRHRPVRDVMTARPVYVRDSDSSAAALCVMAVMGHRHVPVLDRDHKILGIVTPRRITSFLLSRVDA
jgi:CBS domain-containing protein